MTSLETAKRILDGATATRGTISETIRSLHGRLEMADNASLQILRQLAGGEPQEPMEGPVACMEDALASLDERAERICATLDAILGVLG